MLEPFRSTAQLFNVLDAAHEALISDVPTTKRDVYYKDVILFKSQQVVNQLVDDLAATWDLKRSDLGIVRITLHVYGNFLTSSARERHRRDLYWARRSQFSCSPKRCSQGTIQM